MILTSTLSNCIIFIASEEKAKLRLKKMIYLAQVMWLFPHIPGDAEAEQEN